jgi:hypothetical protein
VARAGSRVPYVQLRRRVTFSGVHGEGRGRHSWGVTDLRSELCVEPSDPAHRPGSRSCSARKRPAWGETRHRRLPLWEASERRVEDSGSKLHQLSATGPTHSVASHAKVTPGLLGAVLISHCPTQHLPSSSTPRQSLIAGWAGPRLLGSAIAASQWSIKTLCGWTWLPFLPRASPLGWRSVSVATGL